MIPTRAKWLAFSICFLLIVLSVLIQWHSFLNRDAIWALDITKRMMHGGTYLNNFIENNPPLIFFINYIPLLVSKYLHISDVTAFRLFIYIVGCASLLLVSRLSEIFLLRKNATLYVMILVMTCFSFFILPIEEFGERENLMTMLVIPYILLTVSIALNLKSSVLLRIIVGVLAGIGFAIKPYFTFPLLLIELYLMINKRNLLSWVRIDTLIIISIFAIYILSIAVLSPLYLTKMIPLAYHLYLHGMTVSLISLLSNSHFLLFITALILSIFCLKKASHHIYKLNVILLLAAVGFFACYFIQLRDWYYHIIPMIMFTLLLLTSFLYSSIEKITQKTTNFLSIPAVIIFLIAVSSILFCFKSLAFYTSMMIENKDNQKNIMNTLIRFTNQHAKNQPIFFFSTMQDPDATIVQYSHATLGSRFMIQWLIPGIINNEHTQLTAQQSQYQKWAVKFLLDVTVADFNKYKPKLVFIDTRKEKSYINWPFNYLNFFTQDKQFKTIWQHYHFVKRIWYFDIYEARPQSAQCT